LKSAKADTGFKKESGYNKHRTIVIRFIAITAPKYILEISTCFNILKPSANCIRLGTFYKTGFFIGFYLSFVRKALGLKPPAIPHELMDKDLNRSDNDLFISLIRQLKILFYFAEVIGCIEQRLCHSGFELESIMIAASYN